MPLFYAYQNATRDNLDEYVTAAVIFDTEDQLYGDHLPGYGTVEPDESPDDGSSFRVNWTC